jgi:hypothetical protein
MHKMDVDEVSYMCSGSRYSKLQAENTSGLKKGLMCIRNDTSEKLITAACSV